MWVVFYNKLSWFVPELPEKDISNVSVCVGKMCLSATECAGKMQIFVRN